ncbi:hypothetical protein BB561_004187 [Smittium simulii]|uniref:Uncharacterized protein n=1 Tax=Smittium simulii TaxID=133385 RepID=A0A2T9YHJ9_9FUNG|nr:hypothetical protein BB561_004187 [Smittium simulii]
MKRNFAISSFKLSILVIISWFIIFKLSANLRKKILTVDLAYHNCGNNIECIVKETKRIEQLALIIKKKTADIDDSRRKQEEKQRLIEQRKNSPANEKLLHSAKNGLTSSTFFFEFQKEKAILEEKHKAEQKSLYDAYRKVKFRYQSQIKLNSKDDFDLIKKAEQEILEIIDYESINTRFNRLPGWPSIFPEKLTNYRDNIINSNNFNSTADRLKHEIAPWVWHFDGPMGKNSDFKYDREKAAIIVLSRNTEVQDILYSMRQFEDRFNRNYHYPYIFLNDKPFTTKFMTLTSAATQSDVTYALIPKEHWDPPSFVDMNAVKVAHRQFKKEGVLYGDSMTYRQMIRFNSGFFYKHPLLADLDYYWRLEPNVDFYCDISYDLFKEMKAQNKTYAFVIFLKEMRNTIPTLWVNTLTYAKKYNVTSSLLRLFVDGSLDYNLCHFWSNFEVASLKWLKSEQYESFFQHLDRTGNFYYERWGDAPVHSLAAGLFLEKKDILFADDIGYRHDTFARWPRNTKSSTNSNYDSRIGNDVRCVIPKQIIDVNTIPSHNGRKNSAKSQSDIQLINIFNYDYSADSCLPLWKLFNENSVPWTNIDTTLALMKYKLNDIDFNDDNAISDALKNLKV